MSQIGLKQFRVSTDSGLDACLSYCLYDKSSRQAILIDPHADALADYSAFLLENTLHLDATIDTQLHFSHVSATHLLKAQYGCLVLMAESTRSDRVTHRLKDLERMSLGEIALTVFLTPGVSADGLVLLASEEDSTLLFTGNTLWISSAAPVGFPGSDSQAHFASLERLRHLPPSTVILPAYDANGLMFSILEIEKKKNPYFLFKSEQEFLEFAKSNDLKPSEEFSTIAQVNLEKSPAPRRFSRLESVFKNHGKFDDLILSRIGNTDIPVEKYHHKIEKKSLDHAYLDVREENEFIEGHIPGTLNWPMAEVGLHLKDLSSKKRVYVSCLGGKRSSLVARTLSYLGFPDVVNLSGGFKAWQSAGYPVEKTLEK